MESLTPDILSRIFSHVPYNDLLRARLVSKSFDEEVTKQFNSITALKIITRQQLLNPSLVHPTLVHPSPLRFNFNFKELHVHVTCSDSLRHFLSTVVTKFPAIQAIDFFEYKEEIELSILTPFAHKLKYLRAVNLIGDVEDIMSMFPALQAVYLGRRNEPFCPKLWAGRDNFIHWTNFCTHRPPCENADRPPNAATRSIRLRWPPPVEFDLTTIASSLEVLMFSTTPGLDPPVLHLPKLRHFELTSPVLENNMYLNLLQHAPEVRFIYIWALLVADSTLLSFLSFVNSLPQIEIVDWRGQKLIPDEEEREALTFPPCRKPRLTRLVFAMPNTDGWRREHFALVKNLLDSSQHPLGPGIHVLCKPELSMDMNAAKKSSMILHGRVSSFRPWLEILAPACFIKKLFLISKEALNESLVECILKYSDIRLLTLNPSEEFIKHWLPLFRLSDNKKKLHLQFTEPLEPTRETHDLLIASLNDGSLAKLYGQWICPMEEECTCGLTRRVVAP